MVAVFLLFILFALQMKTTKSSLAVIYATFLFARHLLGFSFLCFVLSEESYLP